MNAYLDIISIALNLALAVVAITPTQKDDAIVGRIANLWSMLRGR